MKESPPRLALAPMATLSHRGLRTRIDEWGGCDWYFSEMVDCKSYIGGRRFESYYLDPAPRPEKFILQFVGGCPEDFEKALSKARDLPVKGFDINMGCSAHQIYGYGGGISWMSRPEQAWDLAARLRPLAENKTLSVKLRLGNQEDPGFLTAFCQGLEAAKVDFITLHPRTKKDSLNRPSRWNHLAVLKKELRIPLWGNGDIKDYPSYEKAKSTGVTGIMIGREAVKSPWIFHFLREKEKNPAFQLTVDLETEAFVFHEYLEIHQPVEFWVTRAQRFWVYFSQHFLFGHRLAAVLRNIKDYGELKRTALNYLETHPEERWKVLD